jgi:hypothetical protein
MALATHTVSVNPVFLQEIKEDHHELRQLIHHVGAMLNRPDWMQLEYGRLVELFTKLRDQLAMHFSLEEAYGYFEDAISVAPHLSRRAERLRAQHVQLFSELCGLAERSERLLYGEARAADMRGLADGFHHFSASLQQHELSESELIVASLNEDIGSGD